MIRDLDADPDCRREWIASALDGNTAIVSRLQVWIDVERDAHEEASRALARLEF